MKSPEKEKKGNETKQNKETKRNRKAELAAKVCHMIRFFFKSTFFQFSPTCDLQEKHGERNRYATNYQMKNNDSAQNSDIFEKRKKNVL